MRLILPILCLLTPVFGQQDVYRAGPGVRPPKITHKEPARYTREAFYARVQGKVVCQVIVDERGAPVHVSVISPLGFGLDDRAQTAISRYRFEPGSKEGRPVKVVTMIEVSFRFPGTWFDDKTEKRRTAFNIAITNLRQRDRSLAEEAVKTILELADKKYPPAMYTLGRMRFSGRRIERDPAQGMALLTASAEKGYAPAMTDLGLLYLNGEQAPRDVEKGSQLLRDAAVLGSSQAQLFLGRLYETGDIVPRELDRARRYYRLCAAGGYPACQFRLAKLMFEAPERKDWEYLQAVTWFELAADRGIADAKRIVEEERPKLTAEQAEWVGKLKAQLGGRR